MNIKWNIKKEILDGIRNYRFLVLFMGFLFFALMDPLMNKMILPGVMKSQFPNMTDEMIMTMIDSTQKGIIRSYFGNVFEIGMLIVVFSLSGIIAREVSEKTLILPVCNGKRYGGLIIAKLIVYGAVLLLSTTISALVCYVYSGMLFKFELYTPLPVLRAGLLQGMYMLFVLGMLMMIGALIKKAIAAGLLTLIPIYGISFIGGTLNIDRYLPSGLLTEGSMLAVVPSGAVIESIVYTVAIVVLSVGFTVIRLSKMELARG